MKIIQSNNLDINLFAGLMILNELIHSSNFRRNIADVFE